MKYDLFISYSRRNFDEVNSFIELLRSRIPELKIWFDIDGIESGDEFDDKIISAIDNSSYILFALSDYSLESPWTKDEVMYAKNTDKKVIPLLLRGSTMKGWFLFKFGRIDYIDITNELQTEKFFSNLSSWTGKQKTEAVEETLTPSEMNDRGDDYFLGRNGKPIDYNKAVKWYRKSAEQGFAIAQRNLGVCYKMGKGVPANDAESVKWYKKSAEQGFMGGQFNLGYCYQYGIGVPEDGVEAVKWYTKSAEQGLACAQCNLGVCYEDGVGVPVNHKEAVKWYKLSAEQGFAVAQYNLGACYELGIGVEKNMDKAIKWFAMSAEQGDEDAKKKLGLLKDSGVA